MDVVQYLLKHGLADAESVVASDLLIEDVSRRNRIFRISSERARSYLVKQGITDEGSAAIEAEARFLRAIGKLRELNQVRDFVPSLVAYDHSNRILVVNLIKDAVDVRSYQGRTGRFSLTLTQQLGIALASLHQDTQALAINGAGQFGASPPWVLSVRATAADLVHTSPAGLRVHQLLQSAPTVATHLRRLQSLWAPGSLVHNDLKWDNYLACRSSSTRRFDRLALVDWETASIGDPCWDLGCVLSDFLSLWVLSMPLTDTTEIDSLPQLARFSLESMQPAADRFWRAYVSARRYTPAESETVLARSMEFAGARIIQTAFEQTQMRSELSGNVVALIQLAQNVLDQPLKASRILLALKPRED